LHGVPANQNGSGEALRELHIIGLLGKKRSGKSQKRSEQEADLYQLCLFHGEFPKLNETGRAGKHW